VTNDLSLAFSPLLPWPVLALLGVATFAVFLYAYYAGQKGAGWRAVALALFLAALADPALLREERTPEKSIVAVVLDRSESQTLGARLEPGFRAQARNIGGDPVRPCPRR